MTQPNHQDLYRALGRVEGKLDTILEDSKRRDGRYDDHDAKIASLERERNIRYGRESVMAIAIAAIGWPAIKNFFGF